MRFLNDIRMKIDESIDVVTDFLQVEGGILILTSVSAKTGLHGGTTTLVIIEGIGTALEELK